MDQSNSNPSPEVQKYTAQHLEDLVNSWSKEDALAYQARGVEGLSPEAFQQLQTQLFPKLNPPSTMQQGPNGWVSKSTGEPTAGESFPGEASPEERNVNALSSGYGVAGLAGLGLSLAGKGAVKMAGWEPVNKSINSWMTKTGGNLSELPVEELRSKAGELLVNRAKALEQTVGGFGNSMSNGAELQAAIKRNAEAARKTASGAFEALKDMAPNTQAPAQNLLKEVFDQSIDLSQLPKSFQAGKLATFIKSSQNSLAGGAEANLSLKQMMALRGELTQIASKQTGVPGLAGQVSNTGRQAYSLIDALDKDIKAASSLSGAEDFSKAYTAARQGWKTFKDTFSNPVVEDIMSKEASTIGNVGFKTPEHVEAIRAAGGEEAMKLLKKSVTGDIMNKLTSSSIRDPQSIFERILATKPNEMERLFTPSDIQAFRDFTGARQFTMNLPSEAATTSADGGAKAFALFQKFLPSPYKQAIGAAAAGASYVAGKSIAEKVKK